MAKTTEEFEEHILDVDVTEEMESSFLEYAYSLDEFVDQLFEICVHALGAP